MPSRITSRHHWIIVSKIIIVPKNIGIVECPWNHEAVPTVSANAPIAPVSGQGLYSTR